MLGNPIRLELNFLPSVFLCFSCSALLLSMLMVFPAILPYFPSWKTAWQWQSHPLGTFEVHLDAPNWRLKRDAQWSLNSSTFLPLLHAAPPTTASPCPTHSPLPASTDRFHFNFLTFSFLFFFGCLDTNLTNAKGDAKLQVPASCQRVTALSHCPLLPSVHSAGSSQHVRKIYAWKASGKCCRLYIFWHATQCSSSKAVEEEGVAH